MATFNKRYARLFNKEDEESSQGDEEQGTDEETGPTASFLKQWGWINNVDTVSETMRISWNEVFEMNIVEFLNVVAYTRDKAQLELEREKEYLRKKGM